MKYTRTPSTRPHRHGSVLMISLIMGGIFGLLLGSYLYLTQFQVRAIARSQTWNSSMVTAEAGLEEGLAMINRYANSSATTGKSLQDWPSATQDCGWTVGSGGKVYTLRRSINSSDYYRVYITNQLSSSPVIKSIGYTRLSGADSYAARAIVVESFAGSTFQGALLAKGGVTINGNAAFDSYNSQDPTKSTKGQYDATKRMAGGNVGSIESNVVVKVSINVQGNVDINGKVATSPYATNSVSGNASVGSLAWVSAGKNGIEPGWSRSGVMKHPGGWYR